MFEVRPYPEFSWSISRQRLLENCPRAYYYRYYLAHNGWLSTTPSAAKLAYRLSKLTGLDALLGQEMDERAREIEQAARENRALPAAAELEQRTRATLREAWQSSLERRRLFDERPKDHVMLRSFYVDEAPPSPAETDRLNAKLSICHENLLAAPHWGRLRECGDDGRVSIPAFAHFFLGGVKAFAAGDLAYVHEDTLYVVDWKSGQSGDDEALQVKMAVYCLLVSEPALAGLTVRATLHYLLSGEEHAVELPDDLAGLVADTLACGVRHMRSYLRDPENNAPHDVGEFPRCESGLCRNCNFTPLCLSTASD
jgi:hypothetical protein